MDKHLYDTFEKMLDCPETEKQKSYSYFVIFLVFLSIAQLVFNIQFPELYTEYELSMTAIEVIIVSVFTFDYLLRIIVTKEKVKYITSFYGVADLVSILPFYFGLLGYSEINATWLRFVKLTRLIRFAKVFRAQGVFGGITGKTLPYIALAIALKGISVMFEVQPWWPKLDNISIIIGVVGFALAILLGTKLNVVNTRIYAIEDAVCRIVGSMRDMQYQSGIKEDLLNWSIRLEETLKSPYESKKELTRLMRNETNILEKILEDRGIGGPTTSAFHRDVAYLLHRVTASSPVAYERFLKNIMIVYVVVIIFTIPGIIGLVSSVLLAYVLSGVYYLIEDMDTPLNFDDSSFIDVRLDALEYFNTAKK